MSKARDLASRASVPRKNYIINGDFDIWQRGTSFTATGYSADRWGSRQLTSTTTFSRQSFTLGQTDVPNNPEYFFRANITSIGSAQMYQMIEGVESLSGETVTLSFYAKAGSAVSLNGISLRQNFGYGGAPSASTLVNFPNSNASLTTSWQKFAFSIVVPSVSGKTLGTSGTDSLELLFQPPSTSLATIDIAQVQLEKGSVATGFEYRPIGEELALCQRYYERISMAGQANGGYASGYCQTTTSAKFIITVSPKRAPHTETFSAVGDFFVQDTTNRATTAISFSSASPPNSALLIATTTGMTAGAGCTLLDNNGGNSWVAFDAEL